MNEKGSLYRLAMDLKPAKKALITGAWLYLPVTILNVIQPLIIGYAVQHGMLTGSITGVLDFSALFFLVVLLAAICELWQGMCLQITGQTMVANLRQRAFLKVQRLSMGFLDRMPMGRLLTRLTNDAESVVEMFSLGAVQILGDGLFLIGTFIMLFFVDVKLSLYAAISLPILAIGLYLFRIWTKRVYVLVRGALSDLNSFLQEYLSGIKTVQISGRINSARGDFTEHNQHYLLTNRRAIFLDAAIYSFVDALSYLAAAMVLWGAYRLDLDHALSLGVLVAFLEALSRFFQPVRELSNRYTIFQSAMVSLDRIYELFEWPEERDASVSKMPVFNSEIRFENVSFSYKDNEGVLKDISFKVKKGEHVALAGQTGAGKSTVIKLLNRFYPVSTGDILIDGRNIGSWSLGEIRRLISVVPQEVFLFKGTIRDNLIFGITNATDEELWHALELVQLSDLVKERGGLYGMVSSKGQNYSLGERQLFAIARALVTDPPILILDEATASVDLVTQKRLEIATREILRNRTALIIAHRLSTIVNADRILVFHRGRIVERGTHTELMEKNGIYAGMVNIQGRELSP